MSNKNSTISFILDGKIVEIDFHDIKPTTTVLNYLRELPNHKGVKEGCAEGDCGACTTVLGELKDGKISYKAVDSCLIFLPMIHGKQLITVECIGNSDNMHVVQQAMVDTDGSQCGYCTPGFITSLFALYKNHNEPSREIIDDALTGNLCRCTGYRSIVEAAAKSCVHNGKDDITVSESKVVELISKIDCSNQISIKTSIQEYFLPATIQEAVQLKSDHPDAIVINGATDIALKVTKQNQLLEKIIDLSMVVDLNQIIEEDEHITFGAGVSLEDVKTVSQQNFPAMYDMLAVFGSVQIRNLATLGGNVASASPIGDTPPVLMAYDATIVLTSVDGQREFKMDDFITGYHETQMMDNEIIKEIRIPRQLDGVNYESYKISKRKDLDISTVSIGARLKTNSENIVEEICLAYGGMAALTKSAKKAESYLTGKEWSRENVEEAMNLIDEEFTPISDARSGADARRVMARNLLLKFWTETCQLSVVNE